MEARKVIIINNKTQSQKTIMSNATTLGELKAEARNAGVNIEGMTWYEGHMRAELKDDASPLPMTVMWKGTETTELTFLLTQPEKKVKSGALDRATAYSHIKSLGLQEACKAKYGKNFTQCSTSDLIALIDENTKQEAIEMPQVEKDTEITPVKNSNVEEALAELVSVLYDGGVIYQEDMDSVLSILDGKERKTEKKMSQKEIDEMFKFVNN